MLNDLSHQFIWPTGFACTLITEKLVIPNSYTIGVAIEPDGPTNIGVGIRKIKYFVDHYLQNSIFVYKENLLVPAISDLDTNLVLFPTDPYDYFVGGILCSKFIAITQKYFHISMITIDSAVGDHIQYCIEEPEDCGLELKGDHWWNVDSTSTGSQDEDSWEGLNLNEGPKFEPRIIKGGRSEN